MNLLLFVRAPFVAPPPSIAVPVWMLWLGAVATALVALGVIGKALQMIWRMVEKLDRLLQIIPVVIAIAEQFSTNGGSSLLDRVTAIEKAAAVAAATAESAREVSRALADQVKDHSENVTLAHTEIILRLERLEHARDEEKDLLNRNAVLLQQSLHSIPVNEKDHNT